MDPLRAGTILPTNSWTVVDIQSDEGTLCNCMSTCGDIFYIVGITGILNAQVKNVPRFVPEKYTSWLGYNSNVFKVICCLDFQTSLLS